MMQKTDDHLNGAHHKILGGFFQKYGKESLGKIGDRELL